MLQWKTLCDDSWHRFGIPMMQKLSAHNLVSSQDVRENVLFPEEDFPEPIMHG